MGRYRAARRRRGRIAVGILTVMAIGAGLIHAAWVGPGSVTSESTSAAEAATQQLPSPAGDSGVASAASPAGDTAWLELDAAWRAGVLPEPPPGWLQAYAKLAAEPCARLELEGRSGSLVAHVIAADASLAERLEAMAKDVAGVAAAEREVIAPGNALCRLLALLNRATLPSPTPLARLGEPLGGRCGAPPCYAGIGSGRLREGEQLVLAVTTPPVASHLTVALIRPDGVVVQLYPPAAGAAPAAGQAASLPAGDALWIGVPRAGAAYAERPIEAPFGTSHVLVLAAAAPLLTYPEPAAQPLGLFLKTLAAALAAQPGPARPLASLLSFESVPLQP
jgi:hypothetical protein